MKWLLPFFFLLSTCAFGQASNSCGSGTSSASDPLNASFYAPGSPTGTTTSLWITDEMSKVQQQAANSVGSTKLATPCGAKNEWASFQIHYKNSTGSNSTLNSITVGNLTCNTGPNCGSTQTITASTNVNVYAEGYYNVTFSSQTGDPTGFIPDVLIPSVDPYYSQTTTAFPIVVTDTQTQSTWVDILIPSGAVSGYYNGTATVTVGGSTLATLPITLAVWNFSIPSTPTLKSFYGSDIQSFCAAYYNSGNEPATTQCASFPGASSGDDGISRTNAQRVAGFLDDRLSLGASMYPWRDLNSNSANLTNFDNYFGPYLTGTAATLTPATKLAGAFITESTYIPSDGTIAEIQFWMTHFNSKGYQPAFEYLCDEVVCEFDSDGTLHGPPTNDFITSNSVNGGVNPYNSTSGGGGSSPPMRALATKDMDWMTTAINAATSGTNLQYMNILTPNIYSMENWCCPTSPFPPNTRPNYNSWLAANVPAPGAELWMYQACSGHNSCGNGTTGSATPVYPDLMIDADPVRNRIEQWNDFRDTVKADLYYAIDFCWYNTCFDGANSGSGKDPWLYQYAFGGHGDGTLVYPGTFAKVGTGMSASWTPIMLPSIRLQLIRDGFQDYEYMSQLTNTWSQSSFVTTQLSFITNAYTFPLDTSLVTARNNMGNKLHQLNLPAAPTPASDDGPVIIF